MERCVLVTIALAMGVGAGCGHLGATPYALYPSPENARDPHELATLYGPISEVDEQPVAQHGATFALLPGCHVVLLRNAIGEGGASGAWSAHLPRIVYAFRMLPAHRYVIDYQTDNGSSTVGTIQIKAHDMAPGGSSTIVPVATSSSDIDDCRAWAAAAGW